MAGGSGGSGGSPNGVAGGAGGSVPVSNSANLFDEVVGLVVAAAVIVTIGEFIALEEIPLTTELVNSSANFARLSDVAATDIAQADNQYAGYQPGGSGGQNGAKVTVNSVVYGPYGEGGFGGDSIEINAFPGQDGGVVLWWGTGALS